MTLPTDLGRDFRYAARSLARSPGFTVVAMAVLALGIGATSAIFSLVSAVWLKPLPFADEERVVSLWADFTTLGLMPLVGRTFLPEDGTGEPVAVVSEGFWFRRLGGDPAAVGRTITLDGSPHVVVGVVPRDFRFPGGEVDVFVPTVFAPEVFTQFTNYSWYLVAKLRSGVTIEAARAEMAALSAALVLLVAAFAALAPALRAARVNPMTPLRAES